jgi:hypothetical protein
MLELAKRANLGLLLEPGAPLFDELRYCGG